MKKVIFFLFLYTFFSLSTVHGLWYGNTPVAYTNGTATWCPWDGDTTGGTPAGYSNDRAVTNSSVSLTPAPIYNTYGINSNQTNAIPVIATSGTMYCIKWDGALPSNPTSLTLSNVMNSNTSSCWFSGSTYYCGSAGISLTYNWAGAVDRGGSGLKDYQIVFQRASDSTWLYYPWVTGSSSNITPSGLTQGVYYTWVRSRDNALNETASFFQGPSVIIDYTPPTVTNNYAYSGVWTNGASKTITLSPSDTGGSGVGQTKWCQGSTCNPATGTPSTSIIINANYNNVIRYQTWDNSGNASSIGQIVVMLDNTSPTVINNYTFDNVWTNGASKTITLSPSDTGGSGVSITRWCEGVVCTPSIAGTIITKNADYNNTIRYQTWDSAGNASTIGSVIVKLDNTVPTAADILSTSPLNGANLLATTSQNFVPSVSVNGGSPITSVKVFFEDYSLVNSLKTTSNECVSGCAQDIRNVYNDTNTNGARVYSFQFAQVCDQAGNCLGNNISTSNLKTFTYNVYANTTAMVGGFASTKITANPFSGVQIADGGGDTLVITLKDIFGNEIISSSGINRKVDFKFVTDNTLYLNQYDKSGNAIYTSTPTDPNFLNRFNTGNNITTNIPAQTSNNGIYSFTFKGYSPTYNVYNKAVPNSAFTIKDLKISTTGTLGVVSNIDVQNTSGTNVSANNIDFQYTPLYETVISGEQRIDGFIEGSIQSGTLSLNKNFASSVSTSNIKVYLEHGTGARLPISNLNMYIGTLTPPTTLALKGQQTSLSTGNYLDNTSAGVRNLYTKLIQTSSVGSLQNTYLSSHISYAITAPNGVGTINPIYNSDIIGKSNYWNDTSDSNSTQKGVKIVGIASSGSGSEIVVNQFTNDVKIFGDLYKASLKRDIVEGAYSFVKGVTSNNGLLQIKDLQDFSNSALTTGNGGVKIDNNTVLYFGSGSNYRVDLGNGDEMVTGKKTIVIIGGNLYIKNNMYYQNKNTDMLGIIVLKDSNGYGGNIYIDPGVTNVVGTIFAEKSVLSYNGVELDGDTSQSILKNQLHIYGSVFSENTIGGSRLTAPACPYYITSLCDIKLAQKYDLNYLRRYFISPYSGLPANSGKVIGGGTCTLASCTGGSPSFMKNITSISDTYITYPVVIEYNPMLSTNPPPLFTK